MAYPEKLISTATLSTAIAGKQLLLNTTTSSTPLLRRPVSLSSALRTSSFSASPPAFSRPTSSNRINSPSAIAFSLRLGHSTTRITPVSGARRSMSSGSNASGVLQGCKLREAFERDQGASLGLWQCLPGANVSRILARAEGVDWVLVDCEHGNIDDAAMHDAVPAIAACGPSPIVRIPDMQGWMIKRALDAGAHGILVPLLRTVEEAKNVAAAAKFPPQGRRGLGSPFTMERFNPMPTMTEYLQKANSSLLTMVQIETAEALEAVDEIAVIPGIDVLFIGPFDLGNNIGYPILDGVMQPELEQAIEKIFHAAKNAGKKCGVFTTSTEQARMYAEKGYHMISIGLDVSILQAALPGRVETVRGGTAASGSKGYYG